MTQGNVVTVASPQYRMASGSGAFVQTATVGPPVPQYSGFSSGSGAFVQTSVAAPPAPQLKSGSCLVMQPPMGTLPPAGTLPPSGSFGQQGMRLASHGSTVYTGPAVGPQPTSSFFDLMDANHDGVLSREEFMRGKVA